ncbi:MAG: acylphosphatase [Candidatus Aenigmatarchaeota archaeon]
MEKHYHILFSGRVQGVGFRYTARAFAKRYNLKGWVMNLSDGRVELEIQGEDSYIENFLNDLKEEFSGYIRDIEIEELPFLRNYKDFFIKFENY